MKKEQKHKQTFFSIVSNNLFVLNIVWKISKSRFFLKFFMTIISSIIPTLNILITRYIIALVESNSIKDKTNFRQVFGVLILLMCLQIIPKIFSVWNSTLIEPILASKVNQYMNELFIDKAKSFDYINFENPVFYDKYTRALGQVESLPHTVFNTFFNLFASIISMTSLIVLIISMDWIIILFAIFGVCASFAQSMIMAKLNYSTNIVLTPISRRQNYIKRILYIPDYAKDIKCSDVILTGKKYYIQSLKEMIRVLKQYGMKVAIINTGITILSFISSATMMILLFERVWIGIYMISDFTALTSSVTQLENVLNQFLTTITGLYSNSMYIEDLKFVYNYKNKSQENKKYRAFDLSKPCKIEVRNLYFRYPNANEYALYNISFTIMPGEKVSIVGLNGSGKTTLIKLLLRFYEPEQGEIFINDINIKEYNKEDLQKNIGVVFQDHHVYAYTTKENIAFEEKIIENTYDVLGRLGMYKKIQAFPDGFNTYLSKEFYETGLYLSGGELQKICIARALNKPSGLYIFDEPSSALDIMSENNMNEVMMNSSHKTMIFISHRLSTVVMADKILVLQNGKLEECGNHSELIQKDGIYSELYRHQMKQY